MSLDFSCPTCGAAQQITNPGVVMAVCEYCENAIIWDEDAIRSAGKKATLSEGFTRLYRGASGTLLKKRFRVLGRVRYSFGGGFWDEWFVELSDGKSGWLSEDHHQLALETEVKGVVKPYSQMRPGLHVRLRDQDLKVRSNSKTIAYPRQIAMYLVKQLTSASLPEIGRQFGGKHHTTVLHSVNKIESLRHTDKDLNRTISRLLDTLE